MPPSSMIKIKGAANSGAGVGNAGIAIWLTENGHTGWAIATTAILGFFHWFMSGGLVSVRKVLLDAGIIKDGRDDKPRTDD